MLDLKAKLLAAGVVTADQVKKVEDEEAARRARAAEQRKRREEGGGDQRDRGARRDRDDRRGPRDDCPRPERPRAPRPAGHGEAPEAHDRERSGTPPRERAPKPRDTRSFKERRADEALEKRAKREHEWTESLRWRQRLDALQAAGKSEQYAAIRGWVMKERLDNKVITEAAEKFFFTSYEGTLGHLTVEPDVKAQLSDGRAGIVSFIGYNGVEHAVVAADIAKDVRTIKLDWLRHLLGVTDVEPPPVRPPKAADTAADSTAAAEADAVAAARAESDAVDATESAGDGEDDVAEVEPGVEEPTE
jgi:uncharacterized protein YaiL (DUF2058 family)